MLRGTERAPGSRRPASIHPRPPLAEARTDGKGHGQPQGFELWGPLGGKKKRFELQGHRLELLRAARDLGEAARPRPSCPRLGAGPKESVPGLLRPRLVLPGADPGLRPRAKTAPQGVASTGRPSCEGPGGLGGAGDGGGGVTAASPPAPASAGGGSTSAAATRASAARGGGGLRPRARG